MTTPLRSLQRGTLAAVVLIVMSLFGCSRLNLQSLRLAGSDGEIQAIDGADPALGPVYGVEIASGNGQRMLFKLDGPVFVQQVLEQCQVKEKYGEVEVHLIRMPGPGQPPLKLAVEMERGRVALETDYALHPGDRLMIRPSSRLFR